MMLGMIGSALGVGTGSLGRALLGELERRVGVGGRVLVSGGDLGRWLAQRGVSVAVAEPAPRRRKKGPPQVAAALEALPFDDACFDAACLTELPPSRSAALAEWVRAVRDGGLVALAATRSPLLGRAVPRDTLAALMIHATLVEIEQRLVGRAWLTTGYVRRWR